MTLDELLEQFDEVLDSGIKIPGRKTVVDVENLRAVVDDIRLNIPAEIKQAKGIVADRADIITNAKREADGIIRSAEERAKAMTAQEEIVKLAQQKAAEIIATSQQKSREMRKAAQDFGRYYAPCRRRAYRQLRRGKKNPRRIKAANTLCKRKLS